MILFKAKTTTGEWVEGDLIHNEKTGKTYIVKRGAQVSHDFKHEKTLLCLNSWSQVLPETVCQYTGLDDKNGNKIFSGDKFLIKNEVRYIEYIDDRCRYVLTNGTGYDSRNCDDLDCDLIYGLTPIGNIHD